MREVRGTLSGVVMTVFYVLVCYPAPWQGLSAVVPQRSSQPTSDAIVTRSFATFCVLIATMLQLYEVAGINV